MIEKINRMNWIKHLAQSFILPKNQQIKPVFGNRRARRL